MEKLKELSLCLVNFDSAADDAKVLLLLTKLMKLEILSLSIFNSLKFQSKEAIQTLCEVLSYFSELKKFELNLNFNKNLDNGHIL